MRYAIAVSTGARRDLKRIRGAMARRIADAIDGLANDPRPHGSTKLAGEDDLYRIRVGDDRIVYQISDKRMLVLIVRIRHRRDVYGQGS